MDLDGGIFWYFGGALVLAALVVSFVGIKGRATFPPSGGVMYGGIAAVAVLVIGAGAFGVANASEEQDHRNAELAEEEAEAEEAVAEEDPTASAAPVEEQGGEPTGTAPQGVPTEPQELAVTSPEDGSLAFDPDGLEAVAGPIALGYDNPSVVTHNIALEDDQQQTLVESEDIFEGAVEITADVVPGEYIYYCTVPGHREGGMEGTLTVE